MSEELTSALTEVDGVGESRAEDIVGVLDGLGIATDPDAADEAEVPLDVLEAYHALTDESKPTSVRVNLARERLATVIADHGDHE